MNTLTIVALAVILFAGFIGWRKGFLRMIISAIAVIVSLFLTVAIAPKTERFLQNHTEMNSFFTEKYDSYLKNADEKIKNEYLIPLLSQLDTDCDISKMLNTEAEDIKDNISKDLNVSLASSLAGLSVEVIAFLITWTVLSIVVRIILSFVKVIEKLPLINIINRSLGLAAGAAFGVIIIWALLAVITMFAVTKWGYSCINQIWESRFLTMLYKTDIFIKII